MKKIIEDFWSEILKSDFIIDKFWGLIDKLCYEFNLTFDESNKLINEFFLEKHLGKYENENGS